MPWKGGLERTIIKINLGLKSPNPMTNKIRPKEKDKINYLEDNMQRLSTEIKQISN